MPQLPTTQLPTPSSTPTRPFFSGRLKGSYRPTSRRNGKELYGTQENGARARISMTSIIFNGTVAVVAGAAAAATAAVTYISYLRHLLVTLAPLNHHVIYYVAGAS